MSTAEVLPVAEPVINILGETAAISEPVEKSEKVVKEKKPKVPKERKPKLPKVPAAHPTYIQMIKEAIGSLKERTGSSQYAIAKYLEDKYKSGLPPNFKKTLSGQLKNLSKNGKLTKVKSSFKLSEELKKMPKLPRTLTTMKATVKAPGTSKEVKKTAGRPKTVLKTKPPNGVTSPKVLKKSAKASKGKPAKMSKADAKPSKQSKPVKVLAKDFAATPEKLSKRKAPSPRKIPATVAPKKPITAKATTPKKTVKSLKSSKSPKPPKSPKIKASTRRSASGSSKKTKK